MNPQKENNIVDIEDGAKLNDYTRAFLTSHVFNSKDELVAWARVIGKKIGYVIIILSSQPRNGGRKPRLRLGCERSGTYKPFKNTTNISQMSRSGTGTKKIDCPFLLQGVKLNNDDDWRVKVICGSHNHGPSEQLEGHPFVGRLNKEEEKLLFDMTKNLIRPRNILMTMKERNKENVSTMRTIYNARHKHKITEKAGRSQMQQLMQKLHECAYVEWHRKNDLSDCIKDLFWAHPLSVEILNVFPSILVMDCTYKTNRYGLPLLEIVGVTCTNLTFSIAFVYMETEREENYTWAMEKLKGLMRYTLPTVIVTDRELALMNSIKKVFPETVNLLCRFHISRNVLANSRKLFRDKKKSDAFVSAWSILVCSASANEYMRNLESLEYDYRDYPELLNYVKDIWLIPYKEKFVAAWTDKIMHFGNLTTNRAESAHSKLKAWLGSSQGDFDSSWNTINSLIELQHVEIRASLEQSLNVVEHNFKPELFKELRGLVSRKALNLILDESKRANDLGVDSISCGCIIKSTHGLPCAHEIAECMTKSRPISFSSIHSHWLTLSLKQSQPKDASFEVSIDDEINAIRSCFNTCNQTGKLILKRKLRELCNPATTFLTPPLEKCKSKGRPPLKKFLSTRRDPSYFEIVEKDARKHEAKLSEKSTDNKKRTKLPIKRFNHMHYLDYFPEYVKPYVHNIIDVKADGHCGFRVIAALLGFGEENWKKVREELVEELCIHRSYYVNFYGSAAYAAKLIDALSYFVIPAPRENWMDFPDMGHLVATRYNVVLLHISKQQCCTYLPMRSNPPPQSQLKVISIGFVNNNHFVQIFLDDGAPIPPIVPHWKYLRLESAIGWDTPFLDRINRFKALLPTVQKNGSVDVINLVDPQL